MSAGQVYQEVRQVLKSFIDPSVEAYTLERLSLLVIGIIEAESASPARIAKALDCLGLTAGNAESIERRIRRTENDAQVAASLCVHPFARWRLRFGKPRRLHLIIDATTQDDRVMLLTVAVWYRGRSLPLAWRVWPANTALEAFDFWEQVALLLDEVAPLLPQRVPIIWLADRAFGTPAFTDLLGAKGWHYIVRVQGQTRYQDCLGRVRSLAEMVTSRGKRAKGHGQVFKKRGWRSASVVIHWGWRHQTPLCLVSDLPPDWLHLHWYRQRYALEATFRDYKSHGWHWEQGQVRDLDHLERLLVGMALATWMTLIVGAQVAQEHLTRKPSGKRRTRPWIAKFSLFSLGLDGWQKWLVGSETFNLFRFLSDWESPNWSTQIWQLHVRAFVFA